MVILLGGLNSRPTPAQPFFSVACIGHALGLYQHHPELSFRMNMNVNMYMYIGTNKNLVSASASASAYNVNVHCQYGLLDVSVNCQLGPSDVHCQNVACSTFVYKVHCMT